MNPTFPAAMQAICQSMSNLMRGVEHTPNKKTETSITGRAFAPGKGVQQETGPEKEAKVREHLRRLRVDARIRAGYPRSDMVEEMEEARDG